VGGPSSTLTGGSSSKKRRDLPPGSGTVSRLGASKSCACIQSPHIRRESIIQHFVQKKEFGPAVTFSAMQLKMP
jgi:hypothetical protein